MFYCNPAARIFAVVLFTTAGVWAQSYYGGLTGIVTDSSGAAVPQASVKAINRNKGIESRVQTSAEGLFSIVNLTPDLYSLEVDAPGFRRSILQSLSVEFNRTLRVDVVLELGVATEQITVAAAPPILETESGKTTVTLEGEMIRRLPTSVASLNDLRSIVRRLPSARLGDSGRMMFSGARTQQVRWDTDGVINKGVANGGMQQEHSVNIEAIGEMKFTLLNANAESPSPALVSILSKSGTNEFHGATYFYTRNSALDANNHNALPGSRKAFARDNYEGITLSGPLSVPRLYDGRNRTFFTTTLALNQRPTSTDSFRTHPTAAMRTGDFSGLFNASGGLIVIRDPTTGAAFPNNTVPQSRLYPGSQRYLDEAYDLPNVSTNVFSNNLYTRINESLQNPVRWDARIDQSLSAGNNLFFRVNYKTDPGEGALTRQPGSGENRTKQKIFTYQLTDAHTFSPTVLNEFRIGLTGTALRQRVGKEVKTFVDLLGLQGIPTEVTASGITGVPVLSITGISAVSQSSHTDQRQTTVDMHDHLSVIRRQHAFKFGVNIRRERFRNLTYPKPGDFTFTGFASGYGLADFMLGIPFRSIREFSRAALGETDQAALTAGLFAQDDWKITRRLTMSVGLRWQVSLPGEEAHGLYYNVEPGTGSLIMPEQSAISRVVPTFPKDKVTFVTAEQAGYPTRLRSADLNNFAPRVGLAWRPFGDRTVIRTAYGIYYDDLSIGYLANSSPWAGSETFVNNITGGQPVWQLPNAFPPGLPGTVPGTVNAAGFNSNLRNPYVQQWNFTIEHQLGDNLLRAQYVGTKSTKLYWLRDLNVPAPSTTPFSVDRRPFPQFGGLNYRTNGGDATYHGLVLAAERRLRHGLTFNTDFTWSKMLTDSYDSSGETPEIQVGSWFPTWERRKWRGNEHHNPKFYWTTTWFQELPFGKGRRFGNGWKALQNATLGGWNVSGILNVSTGYWVSPFYSGGTDPAGIQFNQGVPDRLANGFLTNKNLHPGSRFLDASAFVMPPNNVGRFGTSGFNFLQEPSWWQFDLGVEKRFQITERVRFEFMAKLENVFNHGYSFPRRWRMGLDLSNPATFGVHPGIVNGNREIGLSGRFAW